MKVGAGDTAVQGDMLLPANAEVSVEAGRLRALNRRLCVTGYGD